MKVINNATQIHSESNYAKQQGKTVGLVPTMGALHEGHLALIKNAKIACDVVVCSIFVNPLQFNNKEDLANYPSTMESDTRLLEGVECDYLFKPNYEQVYGGSQKIPDYDLLGLDKGLEGTFRPDHFQGVAKVVFKLFEIIEPDMAFFGLKDYQQYLLIREMAKTHAPGVQVIGIPTVRDENKLALSSRNARLTNLGYQTSIKIPALYGNLKAMAKEGSLEDVKTWFEQQVSSIEGAELEYFEICNGESLEPIKEIGNHNNVRAFLAFYVEGVRLIDNFKLK